MKRLLILAGLLLRLFAPLPASAEVCVHYTPSPEPPFAPMCDEWGPSAPTGWVVCPNNYAPAQGEIKICSQPGGVGGVCAKRSVAGGQNLDISNLGEYELGGPHGAHRIRALWFNLARASTVFTQENLACPTCTTVAASPGGLMNGDITYKIVRIIARN